MSSVVLSGPEELKIRCMKFGELGEKLEDLFVERLGASDLEDMFVEELERMKREIGELGDRTGVLTGDGVGETSKKLFERA